MEYKVVYLEDQNAESVIHDLSRFDLQVVHCTPTTFKQTVDNINNEDPDLILMDFRLVEGGGDVNAPAFSQHYRSLAIDDKANNFPIVLLSNDNKIKGFYQDFTSLDLFDFSINKSKLSKNLEKYSALMKELIEAYQKISSIQSKNETLVDLLVIPTCIDKDIDPRIKETLCSEKFTTNIYMASSFILNDIVKPIGVLIGEDVLAARIGISKTSKDWKALCDLLDDFKYKGIYSKSYNRWWSTGIELWWRSTIGVKTHLRRFSSENKMQIIKEKHPSLNIEKVIGNASSKTEKFWIICQKTLTPVDPNEAFEIKTDLLIAPWIEREYYSYEALRGGDLIKSLTEIEKRRFKKLAQG